MVSRLRTAGCLLGLLLLGACAVSPPERAVHGPAAGATSSGTDGADVRLDIDGALPVLRGATDGWNWSQLRLQDHTVAGDNAFRLDVALNL